MIKIILIINNRERELLKDKRYFKLQTLLRSIIIQD